MKYQLIKKKNTDKLKKKLTKKNNKTNNKNNKILNKVRSMKTILLKNQFKKLLKNQINYKKKEKIWKINLIIM